MDIYQQLQKEHTKKNVTILAEYIGDDMHKFSILMSLFFDSDNRTSQRAAHAMSHCADQHANLLHPYITRLIDKLQSMPKVAIKRNIVRLLQQQAIPETHQGSLTSICFDFLLDHKETVAVKAFSMTILYNMTKLYPELINELKLVIEDVMVNGTAGLLSRGRKILKLLS